ncbi:hypothetical protein [Sphingomonas echinoides]|uniref:hypothetical protein n=1 Tax=Sphingomonas echinoides TaxID=59803 RepID=UPI00241361C6|nr:hypothetical protein [Sphingomonas echinoides]
MRDLIGELATFRNSVRVPVRFTRVTFDLGRARDWKAVDMLLQRENGDTQRCSTATFSALSAAGDPFAVWLRAADGSETGPFIAEAIVTGIPVSADCFAFSRREDGFWEGVTITFRGGSAAVVPYACDAS